MTLPVGTHVFKLTVIDDAGVRSRSDIVVIRVEARNPPDITNVVPDAARPGSTIRAIIYGEYLDDVTSVTAYFEAHHDDRIRTTLRPGGTSSQLPVTIEILEHARPGPRTLEVTTSNGIGTVGFTVLPEDKPLPENVIPASGQLGNARPYDVTVTGKSLKRAEEVTFLLRGRPDTQLRTTIEQVGPEAVTLHVSVSANAEFGGRQIQVTSPAGAGVSRPDVEFTVTPGPLQIAIWVFGLAAILAHGLLQRPTPLFLPVGLLYVIVLAALYVPLPGLAGARPWLRWLLIVVAVLNVIGWILQVPAPQVVRFVVPLIEVALAVLVFLETQQPQWKDRLPPAAEAAAPAVEAAAAGVAAAEAVPTVAAAEADVAAHLKQLEALPGTSDVANLREKVEFIEGIGAAYAAKLNQAGIVTVMDLLQRGATRQGRAELVESTDLNASLILTWINHADLFRIKGVGKQFGELLEAAGVDTVVELAQRNPANLFSKLTQVNAEKKLAGRSPRQDEVNTWVQQAKVLPRVVEY